MLARGHDKNVLQVRLDLAQGAAEALGVQGALEERGWLVALRIDEGMQPGAELSDWKRKLRLHSVSLG